MIDNYEYHTLIGGEPIPTDLVGLQASTTTDNTYLSCAEIRIWHGIPNINFLKYSWQKRINAGMHHRSDSVRLLIYYDNEYASGYSNDRKIYY